MHPNRSFAWTDRDEMLAFVRATSFCTIFVADGERLMAVHGPVVVENMRGTRKLGQSKRGGEREGAVAGLRAAGAQAIAKAIANLSSPALAGEGDRTRCGGGAAAQPPKEALTSFDAPPPASGWSPSPGNPGEEQR